MADDDDRGATLDPADWTAFRAQAHRMLDDMLDYARDIRDRPVWQPAPAEVRARFHSDLPEAPSELAAVHADFMRDMVYGDRPAFDLAIDAVENILGRLG